MSPTAKLISHSNVVDDSSLSLTELVAYCARVSNPENQTKTETSEKLVDYLIKHKHWSPLEMVSICLEVETTRDIARQLLRHRSFSFQEFSQRYAVVDSISDLVMDMREARMQDYKNRQNSIETADAELQREWTERQQAVQELACETYKWALDKGIAKEQARAVLPEGNTISRLYVNGTLRSWVHYIELRTGKETQKEHRELATLCARAIEPIFPMIGRYVQE